jgi:cobalamin biosynthesis protein CobT
MLLALHTISGALRMLSPVPPEEEAAQETEAGSDNAPEAAADRTETERSRGIIDWADDESDTVSNPIGHLLIDQSYLKGP